MDCNGKSWIIHGNMNGIYRLTFIIVLICFENNAWISIVIPKISWGNYSTPWFPTSFPRFIGLCLGISARCASWKPLMSEQVTLKTQAQRSVKSRFCQDHIWVFPKIGVPQKGWFIMENPIKMDDLGVPLFLETPIWRSWTIFGTSWNIALKNP